MAYVLVYNGVLLFCLLGFFGSCQSSDHKNIIDSKILDIGVELQQEMLPLEMGSCLYQLHGLKSSKWYEVKISYPASIPAGFSIQLKRCEADIGLNWNRRLLNTEKLIFKAEGLNFHCDQGGMYVLVTVEPAGIVAMPNKQERDSVIFNIVCDELLLGIPHKAWWVGILIFLCLGLAFIIPYFLPSYLLWKSESQGLQAGNHSIYKDS